jgi:transient receptor potential cation channel subfamily M protein 2
LSYSLLTLARPYFQVYGELFLSEINEKSGCINQNDVFLSCDTKNAFFVPVLLGAYLLLTSILLVNLLVAMFNLTVRGLAIDKARIDIYRMRRY